MLIKRERIAAIIPAKNEALAIGNIIDNLKNNGYVDKVIVIDGNSKDGTVDIAKYHGADVFMAEGKGKGYDMRLFQKHIQENPQNFGAYVMLDGDGTYHPENVCNVAEPIILKDADVVIGSRYGRIKAEPGSQRNVNKFGNFLLTKAAGFLYQRSDITDLCSGYWGFSNEFFSSAPLTSNGFDFECDIFNHALRNYRVKTVPIKFGKRRGNGKLSLLGACKIPLFYFPKYYSLSLLKNENNGKQ